VGAVALAAAIFVAQGSANASTCEALKQTIVDMDSKALKPPGYATLRKHLLASAATCKDVARPLVDVSHCANSVAPDICTLFTEAAAACKVPEPTSRTVCEMLFGPGYSNINFGRGNPIDKSMPPTPIVLDGTTYEVDSSCLDDLLFDGQGAKGLRGRRTSFADADCPAEFLAALERRIGLNAAKDKDKFMQALDALMMSNFAPRGAPPVTAATFQNDAGFQRACKQARDNQNLCLQRQGNMRSADTEKLGFKSQAGAFGECAQLYGKFANMCGMTDKVAASQSPPPPPQPKPQPAPQAKPPPQAAAQPQPQAKPADATGGRSQPPPQQQAAAPASLTNMSGACKSQLNQLLAAADRRDTAQATAAYESLRASCDGGIRGVAQEAQLGLPERVMGSLSRNSFGRCLNTGDCGTAPSTPQQTAQAAANAFNVDEVLNFAFGVAGLAIGVAGMYAPVSGGAIYSSTQFNTINQRARSTYGQGGPTHVAPRTRPSDLQLPQGQQK
jgi:hypothetical protein